MKHPVFDGNCLCTEIWLFFFRERQPPIIKSLSDFSQICQNEETCLSHNRWEPPVHRQKSVGCNLADALLFTPTGFKIINQQGRTCKLRYLQSFGLENTMWKGLLVRPDPKLNRNSLDGILLPHQPTTKFSSDVQAVTPPGCTILEPQSYIKSR